MAEMTRDEVLEVIREADRCHVVADLSGADLRRLDLSGINLSGVNMQSADLWGANLRRANLRRANLSGADLLGANLQDANLRGANLQGADLSHVSLHGVDLSCADLSRARLFGAKLPFANLSDARWDGLALDGLHRYRCLLIPTVGGWHTRIGCWDGTVDELQTLIDGDNWPESEGDEITYYRPLLQEWINTCRVHINARPNVIPELAQIHGGTR